MWSLRICAWCLSLLLVASVSWVRAVSCQFTWDAPTTRVDGSPLTDLAGYRLYLNGAQVDSDLPSSPESYTRAGICANGDYTITTLDSAGRESDASAVTSFPAHGELRLMCTTPQMFVKDHPSPTSPVTVYVQEYFCPAQGCYWGLSTASATVTASTGSNPLGATLSGQTSVATVLTPIAPNVTASVATFPCLTLNREGDGTTLHFTAPLITACDTGTFRVEPTYHISATSPAYQAGCAYTGGPGCSSSNPPIATLFTTDKDGVALNTPPSEGAYQVGTASCAPPEPPINITWGTPKSTGTFASNDTEKIVRFAAKTGRYVKLVALTEINGGPWTSAAEINVFAGNLLSQTLFSIVSFDSQEVVGEYAPATNAIDGNTATFWHTQWDPSAAPLPHEIIIDLGNSYAVDGFKYLPRQDLGQNGTIAQYEFYVGVLTGTSPPPSVTFDWGTYTQGLDAAAAFNLYSQTACLPSNGYVLLAQIAYPTTTYMITPPPTMLGCYLVRAVDVNGLESESSNIIFYPGSRSHVIVGGGGIVR